jgi:Arc/MetJ-type ribon-helix-helix transcriptional regulator
MTDTHPNAPLWWWGYGEKPERYYGPFPTRDEAIRDAAENTPRDRDETATICTAERARLTDDIFNADDVIEQFEEWNEEKWEEYGPTPAPISLEARRDLEQALNAAFAAWRAKHDPWQAWALEDFENVEIITVRGSAAGAAP